MTEEDAFFDEDGDGASSSSFSEADCPPEERGRLLAAGFAAELFDVVEEAASVAVIIDYGPKDPESSSRPILLGSRTGLPAPDQLLRLARKMNSGQIILVEGVRTAINGLQDLLADVVKEALREQKSAETEASDEPADEDR